MMIKSKEKQYGDLVSKAIEVFSEIESIVISSRNNFVTEKKQDRLEMALSIIFRSANLKFVCLTLF